MQSNLYIWCFNDCFNLLAKYSLAQYYYFIFIWLYDFLLTCPLWLFVYIILSDKASYQRYITYSFKVRWSKVLGQSEIGTNRYRSFASVHKRSPTLQLWYGWQGRGHIIKGEALYVSLASSGTYGVQQWSELQGLFENNTFATEGTGISTNQPRCVPGRTAISIGVRTDWIHHPTACQYSAGTDCSSLDLLPLLYLQLAPKIRQVPEHLCQKNTDSFGFDV